MSYFANKLHALLANIHQQQDNGDLSDFLAIFGPTLDWIKDFIDDFPNLWSLDDVSDELLPFLGAIIGYPYDPTRDPNVQRKLIRFRIEFYRRKGTRASLERILEENGVTATILENVPHEGIYQVDVHDPPPWLADMLDEVHPAGTKWVYVVNWNSVRQMQITPVTAMARIEIRTSTSSMAASGCMQMTTS